ncbi:hypothetical protein EBZ80_14265 [bacterium]|nr:hypothetical protein [bacterium]
MNHHWRSFHEAFVNGKHKVMGRSLRPFSLYHQLWLEVIESPLMDSRQKATPADLEIATRVCAAGYDEAPRVLRKRRPVLFGWRYGQKTFDREMALFAAYLRDFNAQPEVHQQMRQEKRGDVDTSAFPDTLAIACSLIRNGFSEEAAWTMPIGKAVWYSCGFARAEGVDVQIKTAQEKEFERRIKEEIAAGKIAHLSPSDIAWTPEMPPRRGFNPPPDWSPTGD